MDIEVHFVGYPNVLPPPPEPSRAVTRVVQHALRQHMLMYANVDAYCAGQQDRCLVHVNHELWQTRAPLELPPATYIRITVPLLDDPRTPTLRAIENSQFSPFAVIDDDREREPTVSGKFGRSHEPASFSAVCIGGSRGNSKSMFGSELVDCLAYQAAMGRPLHQFHSWLQQVLKWDFVDANEWLWYLFRSDVTWRDQNALFPSSPGTIPSFDVLPELLASG